MKRRYSPTKDNNKLPRGHLAYLLAYIFFWLKGPRYKVEYREQMSSDEYRVIVSNHCQIYGPVAYCLSLSRKMRIWGTHEMLYIKEFPDYAMKDFFPNTKHPKLLRFVCKILAPLVTWVCRGAPFIPVYRDTRIMTTLHKSLESLEDGKMVVILAEEPRRYDKYVNELNEGFVNLATYVYRQSGREIIFHPAYVAPKLGRIVIGEGIKYFPEMENNNQKRELVLRIRDEISRLGASLPEHEVINFHDY